MAKKGRQRSQLSLQPALGDHKHSTTTSTQRRRACGDDKHAMSVTHEEATRDTFKVRTATSAPTPPSTQHAAPDHSHSTVSQPKKYFQLRFPQHRRTNHGQLVLSRFLRVSLAGSRRHTGFYCSSTQLTLNQLSIGSIDARKITERTDVSYRAGSVMSRRAQSQQSDDHTAYNGPKGTVRPSHWLLCRATDAVQLTDSST